MNISTLLSDAFTLFKTHFLKLLGINIAYIILIFFPIILLSLVWFPLVNPDLLVPENAEALITDPLSLFFFGVACLSLLYTMPPLAYSLYAIILKAVRGQSYKFSDLFFGFSHYGRSIWLPIRSFFAIIPWYSVALVAVCMILAQAFPILTFSIAIATFVFIIHMYYNVITYSQTNFLAIDNPLATIAEALKKSKSLMNGVKWDYVFLIILITIPAIGLGIATDIFIDPQSTIAPIVDIIYNLVILPLFSVYSMLLFALFYNRRRDSQSE